MPDLQLTNANTGTRTEVSGHDHPPEHHDHHHDEHDEHDHDHAEGWLDWARVAFVALILLVAWLQVVPRVRGIDLLALAGILIGGYPIFKEAIADLLERRMTMELSMTIALLSALAIGEFFTALVITAFVLGAEILESWL